MTPRRSYNAGPQCRRDSDATQHGEGRPPLLWGFRWMAVLLLAFAIGPALLLRDSNLRLVLLLTVVPLAAFGTAEYLIERGREPWPRRAAARNGYVKKFLVLAFVCSVIGYLLSIVNGFGSVAEVVVGYQYSPLYSISRTLTGLTAVCLVLIVYGERFEILPRRPAMRLAAVLLTLAFIDGLQAGYLGSSMAELVTFLVLGTMTGLITWRVVGVAVAGGLLLLPTLFDLRDNVRAAAGLQRSGEVVGPLERFRIDTQISLLDSALPSEWVSPPDAGLLIRTALVPRILDPARPILDIGQQMNEALGFTHNNNISFGHYGTVFWLHGIPGVVVVAGLLGVLFGLGVKHFSHIWAVVLLASVATPSVWPEVTFPNYFVGMIQFWLLCLGLGFAAFLLDTKSPDRTARSRMGSPSRTGRIRDSSLASHQQPRSG